MSGSISGAEDFSAWLVEQLKIILRPLKQNLEDEQRFSEFLRGHGWEPPSNVQEIIASFPINEFKELDELSEQIINADTENIMEIYPQVYSTLKSIIIKVRELSNQSPPLTGTVLFNVNDFWSEFPEEIVHELIIIYLETSLPPVFGLMLFLGIIEENFRVMNDTPGRVSYTRRTISWNLLKDLPNPSELINQTYGWGSDQMKFELLLNRLKKFLNVAGVKAYLTFPSEQLLNDYYDPDNPDFSNVRELRIPLLGGTDDPEDPFDFELLLSLIPIPPEAQRTSRPNGLAVGPSIIGSYEPDDSSPLEVKLKGGFELDQGIKLEVHPQKVDIRLAEPTTGTIDSEISLATKPSEEPITIIGSELSHNISIFDFGIRLGVKGQPDNLDAYVSLDIRKANVTIDTSNSDGFIGKILGSEPQKVEIKDCSIIWSTKTGLHFSGHAGFEMIVPIDLTVSIVKLQSLTLGLNASTDTGINLTVGVTGSTKLGPVVISVENLGMIMSLRPQGEDQPPGAFVDLDFGIDFKPPTGLGIELNTYGVKGGGFIRKNQDEYSGIVELDIQGFSVQAVALLDTRDTSFLFAIFSTFRTPIQLVAGWKITKIGGLIGVDRTVSHSEIASGIRSGILDSILFPDNVIQNAPKILNDFKRVFPSRSGQYLIGPAIRIAYGTPTLLTGDIALILEFPSPFQLSVIGRIRSRIPNEEHPVVQINLAILGAIDFSNARLGIYGTLYDSKILEFTLSGDMAMAASWGPQEQNLIISLGGFNPRFTPPSNFPPFNAPPLKRLTLGFSSYVSLECYFALTTNTLQFGAKVDALFEKGSVTISGFLGFDALVQFGPLYYIVDVVAGFSVQFKGRSLTSIKFSGFIEGPNPHRIKGSVSFSILWWDISVDVDKTFGIQKPELIVSVDPWPILREALEQNDSWTPELPAWAVDGIIVKELSSSDGDATNSDDKKSLLVHPIGTLKVSQKVVPFNHTLTKFGTADPIDNFRFKVVSLADESTDLVTIQDYFAPAQFSNYDNTEKLSLKSFDLMDSGVMLSSDHVDISCPIESTSHKQMTYETIMIPEQPEQQAAPHSPTVVHAQIFEFSGFAYLAGLALNQKNIQYNSKQLIPAVSINNERYIILDIDKNLATPTESDLRGEYSQAQAVNRLQDSKNKNKTNLKVFSSFEKPLEILA